MKGTSVSDFLRPIGWTDKYPTHLDIFGKGGLHSVATLSDRDNISAQRRSEGMLSFSKENESMYTLLGGTANSNWAKLFDFKDNQINFNIALPPDYILLGNNAGLATPSTALIDTQLDIIALRHDLSAVTRLEYQHLLLGNKSGVAKPRMNIGVENLPILGAAKLPLPDTSFLENIPFVGASLAGTVLNKLKEYTYLPNPTQPFNPTDLASNFTVPNMLSWVMGGAWLPETFVGSSGKVDPTSKETVASSALALTAVSLARAHKLFDHSSFIVSSKKVKFAWENYIAEEFANYTIQNPLDSSQPISIAKLYGYQNTYDYSDKAQALDELDRGMIWNSGKKDANDPDGYNPGTLRKAVEGQDYVDTKSIPVGPLVIIDPSYNPNVAGNKFIAPSKFEIKKNTENEFGKPANQVSVLVGEYAKFNDIGILSPDGTLFDTISNLTKTVNILDSWLVSVTNIKKIGDATATVGKVTDVIKDIADVSSDTVNVFAKSTAALSSATEVATIASLQAEITALAAAVTGTEITATAAGVMAGVGSLLNFTYTTAVGASSPEFKSGLFNKYKPLLSENKYNETDDLAGWGKGNIWYDYDRAAVADSHRAGLRVTAWDSSYTSLTANDLAPLSIGVFGYNWTVFGVSNTQQGFVWEAEYENDSNNSNTPSNYRFPKKFSLRDVGHSQGNQGWDIKDNELMNYDLYEDKFNYERVVKFNENIELSSKQYDSSGIAELKSGALFLHTVTV
jgi:hypothetical protein